MNKLNAENYHRNPRLFQKLKYAFLLLMIWMAVAAALVFVRITHPGFGIQGDLPLHYHITRSYLRSLAEGDPMPRWAGLLDGGHGDALFTFYPPLSYVISATLIAILGINILTSSKIILTLVLVIAQASAYCLARQFFDHQRSIIVALFYVLLPSYGLIALHRGFFTNAVALAFVPLALLGAHLLLTNRRAELGIAIFTLSTSAIIFTHVITTYLCGIAILLMTVIYLRRIEWRGLRSLAISGFLVFGLTAFFLIPQLIEISWVQVRLQLVQQDYQNYLLFAKPQDSSQYRVAWAGLNQIVSYITIAQTLMTILLGLASIPLLRAEDKRQSV